MRTIIAATDLSERSDRALRRAFTLAQSHKAQLILVSVVDTDLPAEIAETYVSGAEKVLGGVAAAGGAGGKVKHDTRILRGDPGTAISTLAQAESADLLVVGTHRFRPIADTIRDTTMQRILRQSHCPVLVVNNPVSGDYKSIVAAVDFSPAATAALRAAASVAPKAAISAVHAVQVPFRGLMPDDASAPFLREAHNADRKWRKENILPENLGATEIIEGSGYTVLTDAINRTDADLLSAGAHARTGLATRLLGSFTSGLLHDPPTDLIVACTD